VPLLVVTMAPAGADLKTYGRRGRGVRPAVAAALPWLPDRLSPAGGRRAG